MRNDFLAADPSCREPRDPRRCKRMYRVGLAGQGGYERAEAYREAVQCFKALYVRVAAGERSSEAFVSELAKRVDELESAYHRSRDLCGLRKHLNLEEGNCGTIGLSADEFVTILKTMILDEDAGWVRPDPGLAKALKLVQ